MAEQHLERQKVHLLKRVSLLSGREVWVPIKAFDASEAYKAFDLRWYLEEEYDLTGLEVAYVTSEGDLVYESYV